LTLLDSVHYRRVQADSSGKPLKDKKGKLVYGENRSSLEELLVRFYPGIREENGRIVSNFEESYSQPLAREAYIPEIISEPMSESVRLARKPLVAPGAHLLGTDKAGGDIFFQVLKGARTGIVVGLVTTLIAVPFAMLFGIPAGYFGGRVDDLIQFFYTTLSSIPGILLIVSLIMIIDGKLQAFSVADILLRDDLRVLGICCILGLLGWSSLCRILRAETLKLRELDYVQAARGLGLSSFAILRRHIVPNVMPIILISFILKFSGLVMVEVILQYINIGVPSTVSSWGRIIDGARAELGRDPMIFWPLGSAFFAMFFLILAVNILGDVIRDALDPRLRK